VNRRAYRSTANQRLFFKEPTSCLAIQQYSREFGNVKFTRLLAANVLERIEFFGKAPRVSARDVSGFGHLHKVESKFPAARMLEGKDRRVLEAGAFPFITAGKTSFSSMAISWHSPPIRLNVAVVSYTESAMLGGDTLQDWAATQHLSPTGVAQNIA
jgi:hypothetical protein